MRILQVSTYDIQGGAAIAAYRLHQGLREMGEDCRMLVQHKSSGDDGVIRLSSPNQRESDDQDFFLRTVIQGNYIDSKRTEISNTMFTLPYPGYDIASLPPVQKADIINLHWVACFQCLITLQRVFKLNKPVVWTLHDQWAFTGGCHYSAGCEKYRRDCSACPQLTDDPFDLPAAILQDKQKLFSPANLTIVAPSRWLAGCVRESALFQRRRVEIIPYSLDAKTFHPLAKEEAKRDLGLESETVALLFGAADCTEKRKGSRVLAEAARWLLTDPAVRQLIKSDRLKILCFGHPSEDLRNLAIPVLSLGYLDSTDKIRLAYSAADLFVLPSLEDNLPNTMLEAMSCGTPVIGSNTGGIPDAVKEGLTGWLVQPGNPERLGEAIRSSLMNPQKLQEIGKNCRLLIETEYAGGLEAQRYMDLYQDLWKVKLSQESKTAHRSLPLGVKGSCDESNEQPANLETALGPNFYGIYDFILFKTLKEFTPRLWEQLSSSKTDRAACTDQITNLNLQLQESEADRAARLEVIHRFGEKMDELNRQVNNLHGQVNECNEQLTILNEQIEEWEKNFFFRFLRKFHLLSRRERKRFPAQTPENSKAPLIPQNYKGSPIQIASASQEFSYIYQPLREEGNYEEWVSRLETKNEIIKGWVNHTDPNTVRFLVEQFRLHGEPVEELFIDAVEYQKFFEEAGYQKLYPGYYRANIREKSLEHFIALKLLDLKKGEVFLDVASENSPVSEIYARITGCVSYRQDIMYPPGIQGNQIGGDACNMPIPDEFAEKVALTCSLEHFEGEGDIRFFHEVNRILKPRGKICVAPLYLYPIAANQIDPTISVPYRVRLDEQAIIFCAQDWGNRFARFYSREFFEQRIVSSIKSFFNYKVFWIVNASEVHQDVYMRFAFLAVKKENRIDWLKRNLKVLKKTIPKGV